MVPRLRVLIGRLLWSVVPSKATNAAEEGLIEHSPAVHVRRPRLDYESHAVGLDRNESARSRQEASWSDPRG